MPASTRICITASFASLGHVAAHGVYGVYMALTEGVGKALIADHAPKQLRGTAMGIFYGLLA